MSRYPNRLEAATPSVNGRVERGALADAPIRRKRRRRRKLKGMSLAEFCAELDNKQRPERCDDLLNAFLGKLPDDAPDEDREEARRRCQEKKAELTHCRKKRAHDVLYGDAHRWARFWCSIYVAAALVLSGFLNGFANATFVENKPLGWCMGIIIPVFVFVLFKAAGWMQKQGNYPLAIAAAGFGSVLLFLSVADCEQSLSMLTHTPAKWLSWAFAITIDCGLVVCELGSMGVLLRDADQ